jgi:hypothetical protein
MAGDEEALADVIAQMVARQAREAGLTPPAPDELRAKTATARPSLGKGVASQISPRNGCWFRA